VLTKIISFLEQECKGIAIEPMVVGVSGGPDSVCLLDLLIRSGKSIIIGHFNHQLRPDARKEADMVSKLAARYGFPFVCGTKNVKEYAKDNKISIEEAARKLRYQFLFGQARLLKSPAIAVGHNADDQVETILMHFLRGAGLSGLKGMSPVTHLNEFDQEIHLIRPLLHSWRSEIEQYCQENHLESVQDMSNYDKTFLRNRLRHSLIPDMETYNPAFKLALMRSADTMRGDLQMIEELTDQFWTSAFMEGDPGYLSFNLDILQRADAAMLRNLTRRAVTYLKNSLRDVSFEAIERLVRLVKDDKSNSARIDLADGLFVFCEGNRLFITQSYSDIPDRDSPQVMQPAVICTGESLQLVGDWELLMELVDLTDLEMITSNLDPYQVWMDADLIEEPLQVRCRQEGDRFQPFGMPNGKMLLSDFFINVKLNKRSRGSWPLVCQEDEILWIPGYQFAHKYRVKETTTRSIHMQLRRSPGR
jgi:tRNA(Ile)-lysidine synthase